MILRLLHILHPAGNFCAAALLLLCSALPSGGQPQNEASAHGGGGLSTLLYTLPYGQRTVGFGYDAGLGYTRFLDASMVGKILGERFMNTRIGVVTGLSLSSYSATARFDGATFVLPDQIDVDGNPYDLHVELLHYRERQRATFISIPLMVSYHHGRGEKLLYAQAGLKLSIPVAARYENHSATIRNEGVYEHLTYPIQGPPYKGFGEFTGRSSAGTLPLRVVCAAAVEGGMRWRLPNSFALYAGLFVDYGLNSALRSSGGESLMRPNASAPENFTIGSALASRYTADDRTVGRLALVSAGLKVRVAFGFPPARNISLFTQLRIRNWELQRFEDLLQVEMQVRRKEATMRRRETENETQQQEKEERQKIDEELRRSVADVRRRQEQEQGQRQEQQQQPEQPQQQQQPEQPQQQQPEQQQPPQTPEQPQELQKLDEKLRSSVTDIRLRRRQQRRRQPQPQPEQQPQPAQAQQGQPQQEEVVEVRIEMKKTIEQPVAAYSASQTAPTPDQKTDMDRKVVLLKQNPSFKVICVGHSCDLGREEVNERISRARAEKAKDYLVQQGIDESRISVLGEGSRNPLVPNTSEKNRRINRRVEILIVEE